jgi:hypothetical protein
MVNVKAMASADAVRPATIALAAKEAGRRVELIPHAHPQAHQSF